MASRSTTLASVASRTARSVVGGCWRSLPSVLVVGLVGFVGCAPRTPDVGVFLVTDLRAAGVEPEFESVRTTLVGVDTRNVEIPAASLVLDGFSLDRVALFENVVPGGYRVEVELLRDAGRTVVVRRRAAIQVTRDFGLTMLLERSCLPIFGSCGDGETCAGGVCVPDDACRGFSECPDLVAECLVDVDCGRTSPCGISRCLAGTCHLAPDDGVCEPDQTCVLETGCVACDVVPLFEDHDRDGLGGRSEVRCPRAGWVAIGGDCDDHDPGVGVCDTDGGPDRLDAPIDTSPDDVTPDAGRPPDVCQACTSHVDCGTGRCVSMRGGRGCVPTCDIALDDCTPGFTCSDLATAGSSVCLPTSGGCCTDRDRDGFGEGVGCSAPDCDDIVASIHPGASELCDGVDQNCDGIADETFSDLRQACDGSDRDQCPEGTRVCAPGGTMTLCDDETRDDPEQCNGLDDDCDGGIDEGCSCMVGATQPCGSDVGGCVAGTQTCTAGSWGPCAGEVPPAAEACNLLDDDCDSRVDEAFSLGGPCDGPDGDSCAEGVVVCGSSGGVECNDASGNTAELCDGMDRDCDGLQICADPDCNGASCGPSGLTCAAQACSCPFGTTETSCSDAMDTDCDGLPDCADSDCSGRTCGAAGRICTALVCGCPSTVEWCNGVDDDCDGVTDDGCPSAIGFGAAFDGPAYGGGGGAYFTRPCAPGAVLGQFDGYSDSRLIQLTGWCAAATLGIDTGGSPDYGFTVGRGVLVRQSPNGGFGGSFFNDGCPADEFVIGVRGRSGSEIDRIYFQCGRVTLVRDAGMNWVVSIAPTVTTTPHGGTGGSPFYYDCPPGTVMTGFNGRSAARIDAFTPSCSAVTFTTL